MNARDPKEQELIAGFPTVDCALADFLRLQREINERTAFLPQAPIIHKHSLLTGEILIERHRVRERRKGKRPRDES